MSENQLKQESKDLDSPEPQGCENIYFKTVIKDAITKMST